MKNTFFKAILALYCVKLATLDIFRLVHPTLGPKSLSSQLRLQLRPHGSPADGRAWGSEPIIKAPAQKLRVLAPALYKAVHQAITKWGGTQEPAKKTVRSTINRSRTPQRSMDTMDMI